MISVVIAVHNGAQFIASALRSVMRQTFAAGEIIVVDDGSTDKSADIATSFDASLRVLRRSHQGGAATLNAGVAVAKGDLLAFLDADDLWAEDKLARQIVAFASDASLDAVFGRVVQFTDMECRISEPSEIRHMSTSSPGPSKNAMLIRRDTFDVVGPFDQATVADFPEWYARAVTIGIRTKVLDQVVAFRRIHRNNTTRREREALQRDYLKMARTLASRNDPRLRGRT
jgi:glycosyltransferase involved in cell wall biosynthesis